MILKILGICIFMYICVKVSYDYKLQLKNRYEYVAGIINGLKFLKKEISLFSTFLGEALVLSSEYAGKADLLFKSAGEKIIKDPSYNLGDLFESETTNKDLKVCLIMKQLGSQLGTGDTENEELIIKSAVNKLEILYNEYLNNYETKGRLINKIGVVSAIFISIIIM